MSLPLPGRRMAVIGATGFIGSHLTDGLVACGANVLAVARSSRRAANLAAVDGRCRLACCDILDRAALRAALLQFRPDAVFHLAAEVDAEESFAQFARSLEANALGTVNVLEAASAAGARVLVYADSCKVYGNGPVPYRRAQPEAPVCSYAIAKAAGWGLCRLSAEVTDMAVCALRSTSAYGPRQGPGLLGHVRDCVRRGVPVRLLGGSQTRDLIYVDDLVRAYIAAASEPDAWGSAIPVGGGVELTVAEICRRAVALLGGGVEVIEDARPPRLTEIWRSWCDNADARELLGWSPEVGLDEGLARTFADQPVLP